MILVCWLGFQTVDRLLDYTRDNAVEELLAFLVLVFQSSAQRRGRSTRARKGGEPPFVRCTQKRGIFCRAALRHTWHRGLPPPWLARVALRIQKTQPNLRVFSLSFSLLDNEGPLLWQSSSTRSRHLTYIWPCQSQPLRLQLEPSRLSFIQLKCQLHGTYE